MSWIFRFCFCLLASEFRDGVLAFKGIATPAGKPNQTRNSTSKRNVTNSTHVGRPLNLTTRNGTAKLNATLAVARARNTTKVAALNTTNKTQKAKSTNVGWKTPEVAVAAPGAGSETAMKDTKIKPEQPGGTRTSGAVVESKAAPAVGSSTTTSAGTQPSPVPASGLTTSSGASGAAGAPSPQHVDSTTTTADEIDGKAPAALPQEAGTPKVAAYPPVASTNAKSPPAMTADLAAAATVPPSSPANAAAEVGKSVPAGAATPSGGRSPTSAASAPQLQPGAPVTRSPPPAAAAPPQDAYSTKLKKERAASTSPPPALGKTANTAAKAAAPFTGVAFSGGEKGEKTYPASAMRSDAWFYSTSTVAPGSRSPAEKASGKASGGNASGGGLRPARAEPAAGGGARSPVANSKAGPSDASTKTEEKKGETTKGGPEQARSSESAGSPFTTGFNFLLFLGGAAGCYWCVRSRPRAIFGNAME